MKNNERAYYKNRELKVGRLCSSSCSEINLTTVRFRMTAYFFNSKQ